MSQQLVHDRLIALLKEQESRYESAVAVVNRLNSAESLSSPECRNDVVVLQRHLKEVRSCGGRLAAVTAEWEAAGKPRSEDLTAMLNRQETMLAGFLERMNTLQKGFGEDRESLQTRIDRNSSHKSMHAAYRQAMKTQ